MTTSLEARKLRIIDTLVGLKDEKVLALIEVLLSSEKDFWSELSPDQKIRIEQAILQLDAGEGVPHESVMQDLRKKFGR